MNLSFSEDDAGLAWLDGIAVAATVCDRQGICIFMNAEASRLFESQGGCALVGKSLLDCHGESSRARFAAQLQTPTSNTYTVEKNGMRRIIHQIPWYRNGDFAGVVEMSFPLPHTLPHFVRG